MRERLYAHLERQNGTARRIAPRGGGKDGMVSVRNGQGVCDGMVCGMDTGSVRAELFQKIAPLAAEGKEEEC